MLVHLAFRSIHLGYVEDVVVEGIPAYRFAPPMDVLASPQDNPANAGFCVPANDCLSRGVLKVSVCREGRPHRPPPPTEADVKHHTRLHQPGALCVLYAAETYCPIGLSWLRGAGIQLAYWCQNLCWCIFWYRVWLPGIAYSKA